MNKAESSIVATGPDASENALQVRRVLDSSTFQGSPLLKSFLDFVTTEALNGRSADISEYTIATRVLGRREDFDSTSAAVVRTQAYRLRRKLAEYYRAEGSGDPILIELPKGHYYPTFSRRVGEVAAGTVTPSRMPRWRFALIVLVVFAAGLLVGYVLRSNPDIENRAALPSGILAEFWGNMAGTDRPVIIAFTNPVYLASGSGDLMNPRGAPAGTRGEPVPLGVLKPPVAQVPGPFYYEDGFTGTGEVFAMNRLTSLLEKAGVPVVVKRNRTVTVEDLRNYDTVFLGSGVAVQALQNTRLLKRFELQPAPPGAGLWRTRIVDRASRSGEASSYQVQRDPISQVLKADYAILAVLPGIVPTRRILMLAGLTTSGTQGAAEYATSEHHMKSLAAALSSTRAGAPALPRYFEAVLRIDVARGIDAVNATFVAGGEVRADY